MWQTGNYNRARPAFRTRSGTCRYLEYQAGRVLQYN